MSIMPLLIILYLNGSSVKAAFGMKDPPPPLDQELNTDPGEDAVVRVSAASAIPGIRLARTYERSWLRAKVEVERGAASGIRTLDLSYRNTLRRPT